jgi:hypothetical protein
MWSGGGGGKSSTTRVADRDTYFFPVRLSEEISNAPGSDSDVHLFEIRARRLTATTTTTASPNGDDDVVLVVVA